MKIKEKAKKQPTETKEKRFLIVEKFAKQVLKKYGKYVKAIVMMGSVAREEFRPTSDIDVFVVIDDTSLKINPEFHDKFDADLERIAEKIPGSQITVKDPET